MKNPLSNYSNKELREMCRFMSDHLKKGLAYAPAHKYAVQNNSRNFVMQLDSYLENKERKNG